MMYRDGYTVNDVPSHGSAFLRLSPAAGKANAQMPQSNSDLLKSILEIGSRTLKSHRYQVRYLIQFVSF